MNISLDIYRLRVIIYFPLFIIVNVRFGFLKTLEDKIKHTKPSKKKFGMTISDDIYDDKV